MTNKDFVKRISKKFNVSQRSLIKYLDIIELGLKEEAMDDLMMLSEESLNSSIKTFMEFKESTTFNVSKLPKINSDALVSEEQDNTVKEVTESVNKENNSNIDYEQEIDNWFKRNTNRKYF